MERLKITLRFNGKKKKYWAPKFISADVFWKTLELEEELKETPLESTILFEKCIPLICAIFGDQFTELQLKKGIDFREIIPFTNDAIDYVISMMELDYGNNKSEKEKVVVPFDGNRRPRNS